MKAGNLFAEIPPIQAEESFLEILNRPAVRLERIVSRGHRSPEGFWYDQAWDEWVLVVRGRAGLEIEGRSALMEMGPGDYLLIPSHTRHRVAWTDDQVETVWLAVHIQSRTNM